MNKGFVFGKFLPFHKGHESMISFALTKCDKLTVLVCAESSEVIDGEIRAEWIKKSYPHEPKIDVQIFHYSSDELPNTSVSSRDVSQKWAQAFKKLFPDYQVVITSELYGDYLAENMGITHLLYDRDRTITPISASQIKADIIAHWNYLPASVKRFFITKVVILGTESTGKTTLTEKLSAHYNCTPVFEAGRDLIPDSNQFQFDDLHLVATEHAKRIETAATGKHPLIIIDTDIHITKSYARFIFKKELETDSNILETNKADLHLYLNSDVPHVQDGTRLDITNRNLLDHSHRDILNENEITLIEIKGDWNQRFTKAIEEIEKLLKKKYFS
ncbi:MAG: AAA family ATPase [Crocinitomicaceae bacterium]|nr:AAA family ATPase [Crocinitomicaceae bacterium]MBK8926266.1 AAA family ATPase [Crocinitomicaceae bacterium]